MKLNPHCVNDRGEYSIRLDLEEGEIAVHSDGKIYEADSFPIFGNMVLDILSKIERVDYESVVINITL